MDWKDIKKILFSFPGELSLIERQTGVKIVFIVLVIILIPGLLTILINFNPKDILDISTLSICVFVIFTFLGVAFGGKNIGRLLRIFSFFILILILLCLGSFYNSLVVKIGLLCFLVWVIDVIREIIYLIKNISRGESREPLEEEIIADSKLAYPQSYGWNKNLGFRGFLLVLVLFIAFWVFVFLYRP